MAKKKAGQKKPTPTATRPVSPLPPNNSKDNSDANVISKDTPTNADNATSPVELDNDKANEKDKVKGSDPRSEDGKDATSPTSEGPTTETPVAPTGSTPAPTLSKKQLKKQRKASTGGPIVDDAAPVQTKEEPSDKAEGAPVSGAITNGTNELNGAKTEELTTPAAELEDDSWGFDKPEGESGAKGDGLAVDASVQSPKSPKGVERGKEAPTPPSEPETAKNTKVEGVSAPPSVNGATSDDRAERVGKPAETTTPLLSSPGKSQPPDATTKSSSPAPSPPQMPKQGTLPLETSAPAKSSPDSNSKPAGTTQPNDGMLDDDDAPLAPAKKPVIDTGLGNARGSTIGAQVQRPSTDASPKSGVSPGTGQSASLASAVPTATGSGQGFSSNGAVKPPSSSPTSGIPVRSSGAVGLGPGARSPSTLGLGAKPGIGFGQQPKQEQKPNLPPPPSATPSASRDLGSPKTASATSPKPAAKSGWGWGISNFVNKAQNALETALADETPTLPPQRSVPAPTPTPTPTPTPAPKPQPQVPKEPEAPKVQAQATKPQTQTPKNQPVMAPQEPAPAPVAANPTTQNSSVPPKPMSAIDKKLAEFRAKQAAKAAGTTEKAGPKDKPGESSTKPLIDLGVSPSPVVAPAQAPEVTLPPKPSDTALFDALSLSPDTPSKPAEVTSPALTQMTISLDQKASEASAQTGPRPETVNTAPILAPSAPAPPRAESVVSSKTAGSGLRLNTQAAPEGSPRESLFPSNRSAVSEDKDRERTPSMTKRPSLADMNRTSSSPKTGGFGFGTTGLRNNFSTRGFGTGGVGFGGLGGGRMFPQNTGTSSPLVKSPEQERDYVEIKRDDDLSSVVEGSEPQDVDSLTGENVDDEEVSATNLAVLVDPTTGPNTVPLESPIVPEPVLVPEPVISVAPVFAPTPALNSEPIVPLEPATASRSAAIPEPVEALKLEEHVDEYNPWDHDLADKFTSKPFDALELAAPDSTTVPESVEVPMLEEQVDEFDAWDQDQDDKTIAGPPDTGSPEREAEPLPDIKEDIEARIETVEVVDEPVPVADTTPADESAVSGEPIPVVESSSKDESTHTENLAASPEPTAVADFISAGQPIAAIEAIPAAEQTVADEPVSNEPTPANEPAAAPEDIVIPESRDDETPRAVEQTNILETVPEREKEAAPVTPKKDRKRKGRKSDEAKLAIQVPESIDPSSMPKSPMPKTPLPRSPMPVSPMPVSPMLKSPLPTSPAPLASSEKKKKKKKNKKGVEVEESAPIVEEPASVFSVAPTLVQVDTTPAATEETPVPAEETLALVEESPVIVEPVMNLLEQPLAVHAPSPVAMESILPAPEPQFELAAPLQPEATITPTSVEPALEGAWIDTNTKELVHTESKEDFAPEANGDTPATPKIEEQPLVEELRESVSTPIVPIEEPKPKEDPVPTPAKKSSKSKKNKRRNSIAPLESTPVVTAEAQIVSPIFNPPEIAEAPSSEVVSPIGMAQLADDLAKTKEEVEDPINESAGTPKTGIEQLPEALDLTEEVTGVEVCPVVEEPKIKEEIVEPAVKTSHAEENMTEMPKAEMFKLEESTTEETAVEGPQTEEVGSHQPQLDEVQPIQVEVEEPKIEAISTELPRVESEAPEVALPELSKKSKKKKKKGETKVESVIVTPAVVASVSQPTQEHMNTQEETTFVDAMTPEQPVAQPAFEEPVETAVPTLSGGEKNESRITSSITTSPVEKFAPVLSLVADVPVDIPEASTQFYAYSPTPSELALDLDTPVNLTPRLVQPELPTMVAQTSNELPTTTFARRSSFSEVGTPEPRHKSLEKMDSMLADAVLAVEQEIHPESTTMPDPPPAYSSPKMEPTATVAQPVAAESSSAEPVKRKTKNSKRSKRDKTSDPPRQVEPPTETPVSPVIDPVVVQVAAPIITALAVEEPTILPSSSTSKQLAQEILLSSEEEPSPAPAELISPKSRGSVSTAPLSIDGSVRSSVAEKSRSRASMPPLISIPVASMHDVTVDQSALTNQRDQTSKPENQSPPRKESISPVSATASSKKAVTPASLSPRGIEGFSPFRWFGFGSSVTSPAEKIPEPVPEPVAAPPPSPPKEEKQEQPEKIEKSIKSEPQPSKPPSATGIVLSRSPTSPMVEKIEWSRWPYRSNATNVASSSKPNPENVLAAHDSQTIPARVEPRAVPSKPKVHTMTTPISPSVVAVPANPIASATSPSHTTSPIAPPVIPTATIPAIPAPIAPIPVVPIVPVAVVAPSIAIPPRVNTPRAVNRETRANGTTSSNVQETMRPKETPASREERRKERADKRAAAARSGAVSPLSHAPSVTFQSPRTPVEPLPVRSPYMAKGESLEHTPRPIPRSILKQRSTDVVPTLTTSVVPTRVSTQTTRVEFTGARDVPIYDDWGHAPRLRKDILAATSSAHSPREGRTPAASPISPSAGHSRVPGDPSQRHRSTGSANEATTSSNRIARARTPSPSKGVRSTVNGYAKAELVPVLNDKIIRTKAPKPSKISTSTVQAPVDAYVEPLTSPILLTSDNYGTRVPENTIYQYDGISPPESLNPASRKQIFDIFQNTVAPQVFTPLARASFDGGKMMYAHRKLKVSSRQEFKVELPKTSQALQVYTVSLKKMAEITPHIAPAFRG